MSQLEKLWERFYESVIGRWIMANKFIAGLIIIGVAILSYCLTVYLSYPRDPRELVEMLEKEAEKYEKSITLDQVDASSIDHLFVLEEDASGDLDPVIKNVIYDLVQEDDVRTILTKQVKHLEQVGYSSFSNDLIYIKKENFLSGYRLAVRPTIIDIKADQPDKIQVKAHRGDLVRVISHTKDSYKFGPTLPGLYEIYAEKKFPTMTNRPKSSPISFWHKDKNITLDLSGENDGSYQAYFNIDGPIHLSKKTQIYVNGQEMEVKDSGDIGFQFYTSPINFDVNPKAYVVVTFPWGKIRSEEVPLEREILFNLTYEGETREQIKKFLDNFAKQYIEARRKGDPSLMTTVEDERVERDSFPEGENFNGKLVRTIINYGSIKTGFRNIYFLDSTSKEIRGTMFLQYSDEEETKDIRFDFDFYYNEVEKEWKIKFYKERDWTLTDLDLNKYDDLEIINYQ